MKLLSAQQIRDWDAYTIEQANISSYSLMENAATAFVNWFLSIYETNIPIFVFCGTGNNGGDGLLIAQMLMEKEVRDVRVFICPISKKETEDFKKSFNSLHFALLPKTIISQTEDNQNCNFPNIPSNSIIIDAILGSGLTRPVEGYWATLFAHLNASKADICSVDIPSGLFSDTHTKPSAAVIKAKRVFSFEIPKLAFLMPENARFVPQFEYGSIGLNPKFLETIQSKNFFVTHSFIQQFLKKERNLRIRGHLDMLCWWLEARVWQARRF